MDTTTLDDGVKRQFALPAAIVLGAYAALFLGFVKNPPLTQLPSPPVSPEANVQQIELPPPIVATVPNSEPPHGSQAQSQLPEIANPIAREQLDRLVVVSPTPMSPSVPAVSPIISPWQPSEPGGGAGSDGPTRTADSLDRPPQTLTQPQPIYPFDAKSRDLNGSVVVEFVVDESGRVLNPRVVSSSDPVFEDATLQAIEHWRFAPGTWHGVPVSFSMRVPVTFHLDE